MEEIVIMLEIIRSFFTEMVNRQMLPEYFKYAFVINSLICTLFIGTILGGIGTMVVTKRMAFFSEAVGHAALTVRIDPNITFSIMWEFAFAETKISRDPPSAIDIDKNIPIRVSVDIFVLFLV